MSDEPPRPTLAQRLWYLFRSNERMHGMHGPPVAQPDGKQAIRASARTPMRGATPEDWVKHLEGERPLGLVPILDDGRVYWGAIDIDDYRVDHRELTKTLITLKAPIAICCRTKSGGAHVHIVCSEPVPATLMIRVLRTLAAALGYPDAEIFPKQEKLPDDPEAKGSWINMPYLGADAGPDTCKRYAVGTNGRGLTTESWVELIETNLVTAADLERMDFRPPTMEDIFNFSDGPCCLERLAEKKVPRGNQNDALMAFGKYAKAKYPDRWQNVLARYAQALLNPPPAPDDDGLRSVIASIEKKDYNYACKKDPLKAECNSIVCKTRLYGVGNGGRGGGGAATVPADTISRLQIVKTEPVSYNATLKDGPMIKGVTSSQLMSPLGFLHIAMENGIYYPPPGNASWQLMLVQLFGSAETVDSLEELGVTGQFNEILEQFVVGKSRGETIEEVMDGKPYLDPDTYRVIFRTEALERELDRRKFRLTGGRHLRGFIAEKLRDRGGAYTVMRVAGVPRRVWVMDGATFTFVTPHYMLPKTDDSPL